MQENQPKIELAQKIAWPIIIVSILSSFIIDANFHNGFSGILFFIFNLLAVIFGYWLWQQNNIKSDQKNTKLSLVWLFLSLTISVWLFIRDSAWLYSFNFITSLLLLMLFWVNSQKQNISHLEINLFLPFRFIKLIFVKLTAPLRSVLSHVNSLNSNKAKIFISVLLSLPVVILVIALLYSADLVVQSYIKDIFKLFHFTWLTDFSSHIFIIFYFFIFSGTYYSLVRTRKNYNPQEIVLSQRDKTVLQVLSVLIGIVLLVFSWIQIKYLFLNSAGLEELGINYQKYAHQGFYQLMAVAVIVFFVIWLLGKEKINNIIDTKLSKTNLIISFTIIIETIFILITAMKRLWLFIDALQWATKRFFAFEGMIFFIIILLIFCLHLVLKKFTRQHFLYTFTILFAVNLLFINIINVDKLIAWQNVNKYINEQGEEWEMDFDYSAYVSADGVAEGIELFNNARTKKEKERAADQLARAWYRLETYQKNQQQHFYLFNYSKHNAYSLLEPNIAEIIKITNDFYPNINLPNK